MKKICITLFFLIFFVNFYSFSAANINCRTNSFLAAALEDNLENEQITDIKDKENAQTETNENSSNKSNQNSNATQDGTSLEDILDGENNPITNPGGETSSGDVVSTQRNEEKNVKQKKEKPKYGKYKDADNDPYIQKWEDDLKKHDTTNGFSPLADDDNPQEQPQKLYTQADYEQAYRDMNVPTFSFVHGIDPDQYYDMKDSTWSPYPLLRLNSPLYFKTITIPQGYYLLTPRKYKEDWFILFKEAGVVKYTIPVFDRAFTPEFYYRDNLKEPDMSRSARWQIKFLNAWGKIIRKSKRKPAIQCNIELTDLDNNFLLLELYYGPHKYSTIMRIEKF